MRNLAFGGLTSAILFALAQQPAKAESRPAVVELFTSQGCSSCPPADLFLGELAKRADVIALAFHVDYWDRLGWRDPFSSPEATERQKGYAQALRLRNIYTPQMVIDGRSDAIGSDRTRVSTLLRAPRALVPIRIETAATHLAVTVGAGAEGDEAELAAYAFLRQATTAVPRGENAGRALTDANIVRGRIELGVWKGAAAAFRLDLARLPDDATGVAILLQRPPQGPILGAAATAIR